MPIELLKITSCQQNMQLSEPWHNISKMKILKMRYVTASASQSLMIIQITGFNNKKYTQPPVSGIQPPMIAYSECLPLLPVTASCVIYDGQNGPYLYSDTPLDLRNINITIYIDGALSTDITNLNPVFIEILAE